MDSPVNFDMRELKSSVKDEDHWSILTSDLFIMLEAGTESVTLFR